MPDPSILESVRSRGQAINQMLSSGRHAEALEEAYSLHHLIVAQGTSDERLQQERDHLEKAIAKLEEAVRIRAANSRYATKAWLTRVGMGVFFIGIGLTVFMDLFPHTGGGGKDFDVPIRLLGERLTGVLIGLSVTLGGLLSFLHGLTMDADPRFTMGSEK